jgi:hypothetical protein
MNLFADLFCSKTLVNSAVLHSNELFCFYAKSIVVLEKKLVCISMKESACE